MWIRRALRVGLVTAAIGAAGLAVATPAMATPAAPVTSQHDQNTVDVQGYQTVLVLDPGTAAVLTENGVSVAPTGKAHPSGDGIAFPITGGSIAPDTLAGTIEHRGGLEFSAGGTTLGVKNFVIDTAAGVLTAKVAGTDTRVPLLNLDLGAATITADAKGATVSGVPATLTAEAAAALNTTFGVDLFAAGLPIGTATVVVCL
jgi:hypothetical protein